MFDIILKVFKQHKNMLLFFLRRGSIVLKMVLNVIFCPFYLSYSQCIALGELVLLLLD